MLIRNIPNIFLPVDITALKGAKNICPKYFPALYPSDLDCFLKN